MDFSGVAIGKFHLASTWEELLEEAIEIGRMTKLMISSHQFDGISSNMENGSKKGGATAFALLAESHISVHTWPEYEKVVIDVFTCGSKEHLDDIITFFRESINHSELRIAKINRGDAN